MKAVGYRTPSPITAAEALLDIEVPTPEAQGRDLLVEVGAVSVNPVDTKVRRGTAPTDGEWKILGWDAAGVVRAAGAEATLFRLGDAVFYAGAIGRQGTNVEFHLVDERIVGRKPSGPGWGIACIARARATLLERPGYDDWVARGGGWGSAVTGAIGTMEAKDCRTILMGGFQGVSASRVGAARGFGLSHGGT